MREIDRPVPYPPDTGILFAILICTVMVILNNITVYSPGGEDGETAIKAHHITTLGLAALVFVTRKYAMPQPPISLFLISAVCTSLLAYMAFPFNIQFVNFIYSIIMLCAFMGAARSVPYHRLLSVLRSAFVFATIAVFIKNLMFLGEIKTLLTTGYRVMIYGLIAGGPNQEASILALGVALFLGTRMFIPYAGATFFLSALYMSRGGMLIVMAATIIEGYRFLRSHPRYTAPILIAGVTLISLAAIVLPHIEALQPVFERFMETGEDRGSQGRYDLWYGVSVILQDNIWGYGIMNAIPMIELETGIPFTENNVHNIYMQLISDVGIHSLILYLLMVFWVFRATRSGQGKYEIGTLLMLYFLAGTIRFRAYDPIAYMMLGLFAAYVNAKPKNASIEL